MSKYHQTTAELYADTLTTHGKEVDDAIAAVLSVMTPDGLAHNPALGTAAAALFRERRETAAALVVASENARLANRSNR